MANPLHEVIASLRSALAAAEARAEAERAENVLLRGEMRQLRAQVDELIQLAATQNAHLSDLRVMLRRKMTQRRKGSTDTVPPADQEDDTGGAGAGAADPKAPSAEPASPPPTDTTPKRPRKARAKGTGRRPPPDHLPEVVYTSEVCRCAHCGSDRLLARDREERVRIDVGEYIA